MQKQSKNRLTALFLVLTLTLSLLLSGCNSDSPISTELPDTPPSHVTNGRTELSRVWQTIITPTSILRCWPPMTRRNPAHGVGFTIWTKAPENNAERLSKMPPQP